MDKDKEYTGYKVMAYNEGNIISGADNRQKFNLSVGSEISMTGNGIYLGTNKDYVMNYYAGLADEEVLLEVTFKKSDIITGSLTDREPEISVKKAVLKSFKHIIDGEFVQEEKNKIKRKMKP